VSPSSSTWFMSALLASSTSTSGSQSWQLTWCSGEPPDMFAWLTLALEAMRSRATDAEPRHEARVRGVVPLSVTWFTSALPEISTSMVAMLSPLIAAWSAVRPPLLAWSTRARQASSSSTMWAKPLPAAHMRGVMLQSLSALLTSA